MTVAVRPEILTSLQEVRQDVKRQVAELDRYRALKAIEQTIADFPGLDDVARALSEIRDRVQGQLDETREYRALRTIERIVPELSEVLALLAERPDAASSRPGEPASASSDDDEALPPDEVDPQTVPVAEVVAAAEESIEAPDTRERPFDVAATERGDPGEAPPFANDAGGAAESTTSAPTPSYGIAQFLNTEESSERSPAAETRVDEGLAQFRTPSSQEGRAA